MMMAMDSPLEQIVAVLHDVVEDSEAWTLDDLRAAGFSEAVVVAVDHLTRREGEDYQAFVGRAARNRVARKVKMADLEDNMDVRRLDRMADSAVERLKRYHRAWWTLANWDATDHA
jgi:(p)ppGpp synthase/HD superfamily hydrolase